MKQKITSRRNSRRSISKNTYFNLRALPGNPAAAFALTVFALMCLAALGFAVRAYNRNPVEPTGSTATRLPSPLAQSGSALPGQFYSRLSVQPEASGMRRRLGQRFLSTGREVSLLAGTLTLGKEAHAVTVRRVREESGENISVALDGGQPSLTWNQIDGPRASGSPAAGDARFLIERLALDIPDQFILAQLRGASYYVVARNVAPEEADPETYAGPVWDVVRVGEPDAAPQVKSNSPWHLYYINSSTGLIEKIISQDSGDTTVAELSGWVSQGGEKIPSRITWKHAGQQVMEFNVVGITFGPRQ